jgi:hypothetical protein
MPDVEAIDCDLSNAEATLRTLEAASDTTHVFNTEFDMISDMNKIRRAGFTEVVNNEEMIIDALRSLADRGLLPSR